MGTFRRRFQYRVRRRFFRTGLVRSAYEQLIIGTPNLAGYWRLNEPSGTLVADISGNGYDLTAAGTPTRNVAALTTDATAASTDFNGTTQYANRAAAPAALQNATQISLECWVNGDTIGNRSPMALFGSTTDKGIWLNFNTNLQLWGSLDGSAQTSCSSSDTTATGTTYHIVGTFDGSNLRLYVNGVLKGGPTVLSGSLHQVTTSGGFAIGRLGALASDFFDGRISDAAIYTRVLTLTEITSHYTLGTAVSNISVTVPSPAAITAQSYAAAIQVQIPAALGTGTVAGIAPTVTANANLVAPVAAVTGQSYAAAIRIQIPAALGTGTVAAIAPVPTEPEAAPVAAVTGQSYAAGIRIQIPAALGTGTVAAIVPAITQTTNITPAAITGQSYAAAIQIRIPAALATGTVAAPTPSAGPVAAPGVAAVTGQSYAATIRIQIPGAVATGTVTALTPTVLNFAGVVGPLAAVTGQSYAATIRIVVNAQTGTGTVAGIAPTVIAGLPSPTTAIEATFFWEHPYETLLVVENALTGDVYYGHAYDTRADVDVAYDAEQDDDHATETRMLVGAT